MSIKASDEWKEHALHPEKADTGETTDTMTPAGERASDPDVSPGEADPGAEGAPSSPRAGTGPTDAPGAQIPDELPRTDTQRGNEY